MSRISRWAEKPIGRIETWFWYTALCLLMLTGAFVIGVSIGERL